MWEIFIPEMHVGEYYKYEIRDQQGHIFTKQDPYSKSYENRPGTASAVTAPLNHQWSDSNWMSNRSQKDPLKAPLSIYEVHLNSWGGPVTGQRRS